jgi:hypothetical protein
MGTTIVSIILLIVQIYLLAGFVFALIFAFRWVDEVDEQAHGAPLTFRLLIIPASTLLWPYLLKMLREKRKA